MSQPEWEAYFLVEVTYEVQKNKATVFVDGDEGINLATCSKLNRLLQEQIDEQGFLGEKYTLDVSSPGLDKPLKMLRQYQKNIGRELEVTLKEENSKEKGSLIQVIEDKKIIILEKTIIQKEGKKKIKSIQNIEIPLNTIKTAYVKISFKK